MKRPDSGERGVYFEPDSRGGQKWRRPKDGAVTRGDWWVRWVNCRCGRKHREKIGPKALAVELVPKRRAQAKEGWCPAASKRERVIPFSEIVDDYIADQKAHNRHPANDCFRIGYWQDLWGSRPVGQITRLDVENAKQGLMKARDPGRTPKRHKRRLQYRPATVNRYLAALRHCFNVAIRNGKAVSNPVVGTRFLRENNTRLKYLTAGAETALLDALDSRYRQMAEIAIHTGLRWSEQMGLRWRDCDVLTGTLTVPRSKHGEMRHVPMNSRVRSILVDLATRRLADGDAHVFADRDGTLPGKADRWFTRAVSQARQQLAEQGQHADSEMLDGFTWHCLRHTFASRLAMAGVDLLTIKELGGWKTLAMVIRYAHLSPGRLQEGVERLVRETGPATATELPSDTRSDTRQPAPVGPAA
jgi:integrase